MPANIRAAKIARKKRTNVFLPLTANYLAGDRDLKVSEVVGGNGRISRVRFSHLTLGEIQG